MKLLRGGRRSFSGSGCGGGGGGWSADAGRSRVRLPLYTPLPERAEVAYWVVGWQ